MRPEPLTTPSGPDGAAEPRRAQRRANLWWRLSILVLVPVVLYALYAVAEKSVETYRLRYQAAVVRADIEATKAENLRLQAELEAARSDAHIEEAARRHLNLIKPGDQPVVLIGPLPTASPTPRSVATPQPGDDLPPWLFWLLTRLGL